MKKCIVTMVLLSACCLSGCGKPEPTVLDKDERQSLGELMAKEAEAEAANESENPE